MTRKGQPVIQTHKWEYICLLFITRYFCKKSTSLRTWKKYQAICYRPSVHQHYSSLYELVEPITVQSDGSIFKHPVAWHIKQSIIPSVMQQSINLLSLSLNTTCFGPIWPSSGIWYCRNCHTASMCVKILFYNNMWTVACVKEQDESKLKYSWSIHNSCT
jgi:hypothetical protein